MNRKRLAKQVAVAAGFLFLCAGPRLSHAQSSAASPAQEPHAASPAAQAKKNAHPTDIYEGLEFSDDQKAKIGQIHHDVKSRMDAVVKDEKLNSDQKEAMVEGYQRMENGEIFKVLTPEQQVEVRKRVHALQQEQQKQQKKPVPH